MALRRPSRALDNVALALASAGFVAHVAFLSLFAWRSFFRFGLGKYAPMLFALVAAVGLAASFLGGVLVRYGGRTKAARLGIALVALETALASCLLVAAAYTD